MSTPDPRDRSAFGHWLAGFTDGEGCFLIYRSYDKARLYVKFACWFVIDLRRDDRPILEEICRYLGAGSVVEAKTYTPHLDAKPKARFVVRDRAGAAIVRDTFRRYPLRAKKARDFAIWSHALDLWTAQRRGSRFSGPSDKTALAACFDALRRARAYDGPGEIVLPARPEPPPSLFDLGEYESRRTGQDRPGEGVA